MKQLTRRILPACLIGLLLLPVFGMPVQAESNVLTLQISDVRQFTAYHVLKNDGTVWEFTKKGLAQVQGLKNVIAVASKAGNALALQSDGTVWAWGSNSFGQLGDATLERRDTPGKVLELSDVIAISVGDGYSVASKNDGTVWAWGHNWRGQLGDGTIDNQRLPVRVIGPSDIVTIDAGTYHSLGLDSDGGVWTWGNLASGTPGVQSMSDVVAIAAGSGYSLMLKNDGVLWACGSNTSGQLGDNTNASRPKPVQVFDYHLGKVKAIASGGHYSVAIKTDGTVWTWGYNDYGELGDPTRTDVRVPHQVEGISNAVAIASGSFHTLVLLEDGTMQGFGRDGDWQKAANPGNNASVRYIGNTTYKATLWNWFMYFFFLGFIWMNLSVR